MKRFVSVLMIMVLVCVTVGGIFAAGTKEQPASAGGKLKVAMVLKTLSSQYWKIVAAGAMDAAKKHNVELILQGPASEDMIEQQINMLQDVLTQKPAVLCVAPSQPPTVIPVLEKAKAQGVPAIIIDTPMPSEYTNYASFIGTTNINGGRQGGKYLASLLQKGDKVALLLGAPGNPSTTDRVQGAKEELEAAGMVIAAVQPAYSDRDRGFSVIQNILQANPDIKGVFSSNDEMALGAIRALQQAGKRIPVIGFDAIADAAKAVLSGDMAASVAQHPYDMGRLGVEMAIKLSKGETIEKRIDSGTEIINKANAQKQLDFLASIQ
jgi:ribose transport system substrate-binding protein